MKRKNIYIILLLSMFALTSCKVGKSYVRPEMALPDSLAQQQDSMSIADEQWQAIYTDSTLRALIDRALEYNKDMLIAASRVKEMDCPKTYQYCQPPAATHRKSGGRARSGELRRS